MFYKIITILLFFVLKISFYAQATVLQGIYMPDTLKLVQCTQVHEWAAAKQMRQKYFFDNVPIQDPYTWTFNDSNHFHFVIYKDAIIVGYAHIQQWPESRAALRIIVIDEKFRNQGYGGKFLKLCEEWLQQENFKTIHTESSPEARFFYEKHGYHEIPFDDPDGHETSQQDTPMGKILIS